MKSKTFSLRGLMLAVAICTLPIMSQAADWASGSCSGRYEIAWRFPGVGVARRVAENRREARETRREALATEREIRILPWRWFN